MCLVIEVCGIIINKKRGDHLKTLLESSLCDNAVLLTFIFALISTFALNSKNFIINKEYEVILKKIGNKYAIVWIFLFPLIIVFSIYFHIKSSKYYTTFFGLFLMICVIYYIYKTVKLINKKEFDKTYFSFDDKYNIILSQFFYFIFFMQPVYLSIINNLNSITNEFISDSILLFYMSVKLIAFTFYLLINILLTSKNLYKLLCPNLYQKTLKFKSLINDFEPSLVINRKNISLTFPEINSTSFFNIIIKVIESFCSKKNLGFYIKVPTIILIFYAIQFIKVLLILIINTTLVPLTNLHKKFKNEIVFFYKLLYMCIFISISLIFMHILNHDIFNPSAVKLFEFFGITILISIVLQQLKDIPQYTNKQY